MEIVTKKYLILLFVMLALSVITAGIYLFANSKINGSTTYTVDKYSDVTNWCETSIKDGKLSVDCKALLINIDVNSCFEVQIITKNKELKNLTVCEKSDTLTYSNDILGYKKLMPVDMIFTYTKEGMLGNYSFSNASFTRVDDSYVPSIVNEDIANLVTIDPSTTTIQNSVDFCPGANSLPNYITDENAKNYVSYTNANDLGTKGKEFEIYDASIEIMNLFLPCYYSNNCKYSSMSSTALLESGEVFTPKWGKSLSNYDYDTLAQLSYLYSGQDKILATYSTYIAEGEKPYLITPKEVFAKIVKILSSSSDISEEIFCTVYQAIDFLSEEGESIPYLKNSMQGYINRDISNSTFPLCSQGISKEIYDKDGIYIMYKVSIKKDLLEISNRCLNLNNYLQ